MGILVILFSKSKANNHISFSHVQIDINIQSIIQKYSLSVYRKTSAFCPWFQLLEIQDTSRNPL